MVKQKTESKTKKNTGIIKMCIDKDLPYDRTTQMEAYEIAKSKNMRNIPESNIWDPMHLALVRAKYHKVGDTLKVKYLNGTAKQKSATEHYAKQWEQYANIKFDFMAGTTGESDIRIGYKIGGDTGSWSYIGTDIFNIKQDRPTMNFGWLDVNGRDTQEYSRTVTHEFGHSLGFIHEHQNPSAKIPWDRPAVYSYYGGPPNNWSKSDVDNNLFKVYDSSKTQYSQFDPKSIMAYRIDNKLTIGDFEIGANNVLSAMDKSFAGVLYPKTDPVKPNPEHYLTIGETKKASIGAFQEEDYYEFDLKGDSPTNITLYTEGNTDMVVSLLAADNKTVIAWDDDSGQATNAKIMKTLNKGKYIVRARHYSAKRLGEYTITLKA
jgi:hypothetical protein